MAFIRPGLWQKESQIHQTGDTKDVRKNANPTGKDVSNTLLTQEEKEALLAIARDTLETHVRGKDIPNPLAGKYPITDRLKRKSGAFVTLKKKEMLRGCIGYILPIAPLYESIQQNTINAAVHDTRFSSVSVEELPEIHIEISVLSEPLKIASYKEIKLGTHGIILKKGFHQAVFLPQVAPEQGWNVEETLSHLSLKAGLRIDAWKDPDTTFSVFTAEVFEEHER
jgi:hypothetical protein